MSENLIKLIKGFRNPEAKYRPQYFWFLNHDMDIREMKRQVDKMKASGAGGAFLHSRGGRITPYMGDKWLQMSADIIKYGADNDMLIWLYDEDGFPSGFSSGKTVELNPKEFSANFIVLADEIECEPGEEVNIYLNFENPTSELYGIVALPVKETDVGYELLNYPSSVLDITDSYQMGKLGWQAPESGDLWLILPFLREWNPNAANVLSKEAMGRFIEITHQKYYDYFKETGIDRYMGTTIPGIFTDEPGVMYCIGDKSWRRIVPYTPEMDLEYVTRYKTSLLAGLPAVFHEVEKENPNYRLNYWEMVSKFYSEAYFKQIYDWCQDHKIASTGHLANDACLFNQVRDQVNWFNCAQYMHFGPSDQLGTAIRPKFESSYSLAETDNMMTPRFAASAGRIYGLKRNISECFGSSGWEITLEKQKQLIDWQIANGINLFIPHDYSYSIEGVRKRDHPPAFERCSYFEELNVLNDYIGRLSFLFSQEEDKLLPRIGLVYGNLSVLANMNPMKGNVAAHAHDAQAYTIDLLQRLHYDFDILPEEYIIDKLQLNPNNGLLEDNHNSYDILLFSSLNTIRLGTLKKLIAFYDNGGKILFIQKIPNKLYGDQQYLKNIESLYDLFGLFHNESEEYLKKTEYIEGIEHLETIENDAYGRMGFLQAPQVPIWNNHLKEDLHSFLVRCKHRGVSVSSKNKESGIYDTNGDIAVRRWQLKDGRKSAIFFIANMSDKTFIDSSIIIQNYFKASEIWESYTIYSLNSFNGDIHEIPNIDIHPDKMGNIRIYWNIQPFESIVLLVTGGENVDSGELFKLPNKLVDRQSISEFELEKWCIKPLKHNILNLNKWSVEISVEKAGVERPSYLRFSIKHSINIDVMEKPTHLQLIIDGDITHLQRNAKGIVQNHKKLFILRINNKEVKKLKVGEILDHHMIETDNIADLFETGLNVVELTTHGILSSPMFSLTEPLRLYGNFTVESPGDASIYVLTKSNELPDTKLGDMRKSGFPNYIFPIEYETSFDISDSNQNDLEYALSLENPEKALVKILLNDELQGYLWWGKYLLKLKNTKEGSNKLKLVYFPYPNSLFENTEMSLGLLYNPKIRIYKNIV